MPVPIPRVRPRLPASPLALGLLTLSVGAGGWVGFTPQGTAASAVPIALVIEAAGSPPDCEHPWAAWAHSVLGLVDARRFDDCAAIVAGGWRRRTILVRFALQPDTRPAPRANAARLLLLGAVDDQALAAQVLLTPPNDPVVLIDEAVFTHATTDLGLLAETAPIRGVYDRALLLRDENPAFARAALGPLRDELPPDEQARLDAYASPPSGLPGSDDELPAPPNAAPPPAAGLLALVPERQRDHVSDEASRIVQFLRAGPGTLAAADPAARWALALISREGPARPSVHAVLRGDPAPAEIGAWVASVLATEAGLTPEVRRRGGGFQVQAGAETLAIGRCGARWRAAPVSGPAIDAAALREGATAAVVAGLLRAHDITTARELAELLPLTTPPALIAVLALSETLPEGRRTLAPTPGLLHPPRSARHAPAPPPPAAPPPFTLPPDADARALVAWWAAQLGAPELAHELAGARASGPFEQVRVAALAFAGEPGVEAGGLPDPACLPATMPWPPP